MRHLSLAVAALTTLAACQYEAPKAPKIESRNDAVFVNGDFEDGTLTGWTVSTFQNKGITYPPASRADLKLLAGGTNKTRVLTGATESIIPAGLTSAASLRVPKYGQNAVVVNELGSGYNANSLVQQFVVGASDVDPTDNKVHVRFALAPVLNSGGHGAADQPYFWVTLTNVTKGATLFGTFNFADQAGVPWQVQGTNYFTDWQSFDIAPGNVALALGDTVRLEVIGAGCSQSGHWGEVYVDGFGAFLPGLQLAASAAQSANAGSNLTYTVNYQNRGTGAAANTTVTFNLPANVSYQSVSAPGASCTAPAVGATTGQVICNVGTVNPNAAGSFTITVQIAGAATGKISAGNYSIRADGVTPLIGPLVETNITTAVSYADLGVTLTDGVAAVGWGQPYSFSFTVTNAGPVTATSAPVSWTMPAQLASASWSCTGTGTCGSGSGTGSIASTVTLPANTSVTYTVSGTLITGSSSSSMTNLVTVSAPATITDNNTSNNQAIDTNAIGALRTITFAKSGTGTGRVVTSPAAIDCVAGCSSASTSFIDGTVVSVTATATTGHSFGGWSGLCTGTANPCSFTVSGDGTLTGAFVGPSSTITASSGAGGSISPSGAVSVANGANQTFTLTPSLGYRLADVLVDGASVGAVSSYTFTNVTAPHTIAATFALDTFILASSAGANGSISSSQTVAYGGSATFTITPAANYRVASVLVDGVSVGAVSSFTFSNVTAAHTIAATFAINTFAIASSAGANGSISGSQTVPYGGSATFTLTPAANYHVASVLVDGVSVGAVSSYTFSNVTAAHTIAATFAIDTFTILSSAGLNGSISNAQTVSCGGSATFAITPAANFHVANVLVDGVSVGAVSSYTFSNVTAAHTIAASFAIDTFTVSSSAGANGSISSSQTVAYGGSATFTITPAANHHVASVLVDGQPVGALSSYTFTNVTAAHTIAVTFAIDTFTVSSSAGANGSISSSQTVAYGGSATFTITPAANHHVASVLVDGQSVGAVTLYTFSNVTAAHTIAATFAIDTFSVSSSAGANGSLSSSQTVAYGGSATFTITPAASHHIADVLVDGQTVGAVSSYTFSNVTAAHTISATFAIDTFAISSSAGANGSISPSQTVEYGDSATFNVTPAAHHHITDVLVDGESVGAVGSYSFSNVTAAHTIAATFAIDAFLLSSSAGANGSITASQTVDFGGAATFTITPAANHHIDEVIIDGQSVGAVGSYTFSNVTQKHSISASFSIDTFVVTSATGANGTITASQTVSYGGSATFAVTPAAHHHIADVRVDGESVGALASYTFTNVTAAHTITATFAIDTNPVTSSAGPNGSISASQSPGYGGMAIFTITPAAHHHILDVVVDGESVGAVSSYWFVNVTAPHTISATFAIDAYLVSSSAGANGTISASQTVDHGDSATFTIAAAAHHHIADVLVDGESVGALGTYTFENVTAVHSIAASFAVDTFVISATGDQNGTVTCTSPVAYGDAAICTITPAQGYELVSLFDDGTEVSAAGATYSALNVTGARTITATFKLSSGVSCASSADCGSGRCVDGVCCNSACNGQCEACDVAGHVGECTPVAGAPHGARTACDSDGSSCGGSCDGTARSACVYPGASTSCRDASCAGGVATLAAACDGQGSCPAEQTQACAPYVCGATACAGDCVRDSDCSAGNWCAGGVCEPKKLAGLTCASDNQCGTGFCTDGVCCNVACNGQCEACDVSGSVGSCAPVTGAPHAGRPECASDQTACGGQCDGDQRDACAYPTASTQCRAPSCGSGVATLAAACDGQGACPVEQTQVCGAFICGANACLGDCQADSDCAAGNWCSAGVCVAKAEQGGSCATDNQCGSGFCTDGVCCNSSCDGQCQACDVAGHAGTCTPVIGAPHGERRACDTDGSSCGGVCNGEDVDACEYPTVSCRAASCEQGVATVGASCSAGHCPAVQEQSCGQFACGVEACNGDCANDSDCAAGSWCSAGVCVPRLTLGGSCTADSQCGGGNCVDGVCCNTACDGQCEACDVAGSVGTCAPVAGAPHGDRVACTTDGSTCGGTCDGTKRDSCTFPAANVQCVAASCTNGVETQASTCTGAGSCSAPQTALCGMNTCGATACSSAMCETDADCGANATCAAGVCEAKNEQMEWKVEGGGFGCQATGGDISGLGLALLALTYLSRRRAVREGESKSSSEVRRNFGSAFIGRGLDVGVAASLRASHTTARAVIGRDAAATPVDSVPNGEVSNSTTRSSVVGRDAVSSDATTRMQSALLGPRISTAASSGPDALHSMHDPAPALSGLSSTAQAMMREELRSARDVAARSDAAIIEPSGTISVMPTAATPVRASLLERMRLNRNVVPEASSVRSATSVRELLASDADSSLLSAINARRRSGVALATALVGLVAMTASPAHAQAQSSAVSRTFLLERFTPQAGDGDVLGVQSPSISPHLLPRVLLWGSYADVPLRAVRLTDDDTQQVLAANQTTLTLAGSLGLFGRVELGLAVPVVITQSVGAPAIDAGLTSGGGQVSLGDMRIQAKARLFDVGAFSFGASLPVTLPTAGSAPYAGSSGVTATPTLLAQWSGPRRSAVLLDLGVVLRQPQQLLNLTVGNAMAWSLAGKIDLLPQRDLSAMLSVGGELGLVGAGAAQNPLEALVALRWMPIKGLALTLGAGPGLSAGYGTPRFRVVASIGWVPPERALPAHPPASPAADQALSDPLPRSWPSPPRRRSNRLRPWKRRPSSSRSRPWSRSRRPPHASSPRSTRSTSRQAAPRCSARHSACSTMSRV